MKFAMICAVAALMAAALSFPAHGYCRGCVIETPAATTTLASADASALPIAEPKCHMEKRSYWKSGRKKFRQTRVCE
jgi:hypothetical protein